jgi:hypothetical protein
MKLGTASHRLLVGGVGAAVVVALSAAPAGAVTVQHSYEIYGAYILESTACPTASVTGCISVGSGAEGADAAIVSFSNIYPADGMLDGIACPTASGCLAVGAGNEAADVIVTDSAGRPQHAETVAGTGYLTSVACTPAASPAQRCVAVGYDGAVVPMSVGGSLKPLQTVPRADLYNVACPTAAGCLAVGRDPSTGTGVLVRVRGNRAGAAVDITGTSALVAVACSTPTTCVAVGRGPSGPLVVPVSGTGATGAPTALPLDNAYGVTCVPTTCEAIGNSGSTGQIVPVTPAGVPAAPVGVGAAYELVGAACPTATSCLAVGWAADEDGGDVTTFTP